MSKRPSASSKTSSAPSDEAVPASAKMGIGIEDILEAVVAFIPPPKDPGRLPARLGLRLGL
jgi:translation elongation factor EF-4